MGTILVVSRTLSLVVNSSCSRQLGMESGEIEDYQITASSSNSAEVSPDKVGYYFNKCVFSLIKRDWTV